MTSWFSTRSAAPLARLFCLGSLPNFRNSPIIRLTGPGSSSITAGGGSVSSSHRPRACSSPPTIVKALPQLALVPLVAGVRANESLGRSPMPRDERTRLGDCPHQRIGLGRLDLGQQEGAGICGGVVCAISVFNGRLRSTASQRGSWHGCQFSESVLYVRVQ